MQASVDLHLEAISAGHPCRDDVHEFVQDHREKQDQTERQSGPNPAKVQAERRHNQQKNEAHPDGNSEPRAERNRPGGVAIVHAGQPVAGIGSCEGGKSESSPE